MLANFIENFLIVSLMVSSMSVIVIKNPIISLLSLVLTFALSSILFIYLGIDFLSLIVLMVYIGAIAVVFLFVIMMLNVKIVELRSTYLRYLPIGIFIIFFFLLELFFFIYSQFYFSNISFYESNYSYLNWFNIIDFQGSIYLLGSIIYSLYSHIFIILALILFVAMIGCIVLIAN